MRSGNDKEREREKRKMTRDYNNRQHDILLLSLKQKICNA